MTGSSVLRELPLPVPNGVSLENDRMSSDALVSTMGPPCCLCPHALAYQSVIHGRTLRRKNNERHESTGLSWETSLAPHLVTQIVSNRDGSILAAATDHGTVSLLRGSDGRVLVTRQVSQTSTELCFVPRGNDDENGGDTLLIQTQEVEEGQELQCLVVTNILGNKLNGLPESATEALRQLVIRAIPKEADGWRDVVRVTALFTQKSILRLVAVDAEGGLRVFDWNVAEGTVSLVKERVPLKMSNDIKEWAVDVRLGFMTQPVGSQNYIVFAACAPGSSALAWFDPISMVCVSHIPLKVQAEHVGVFVPIPSHESTLAVAVVLRVDTTTQLHVFQLVVEETMGLAVMNKPHMIFTVPIDCPLHAVSLASTLEDDVYAFEFQFSRNGHPVVTEVRPAMSNLPAIGKIRYYLQTGNFDQADEILANLDKEYTDPLANFHPSEVASGRLHRMVASENPQKEGIEACLQRLAQSAMSLNKTPVETFAQACEMIPDQQLHHRPERQLAVIELVLRFVQRTIDDAPSLDSTKVKDVENILLDRKRALRFVAAIPDEKVSQELIGARSTEDLLEKLLSCKQYLLVEKLWDWEGGTCVNVDSLLTKLVHLSPSVDPTDYIPLLKNILLPNLTIHHELMPILRAWTCHSATGMDENEVGLEPAIALLETVRDGIQQLRLQLHSSFASSSPFVDGLQPRKSRRATSTIKNTSLSTSHLEKTLSSTKVPLRASSNAANRPPPTILRLGGLKAGAAKLTCKTVGKWSTGDDIDEECVEQTLSAAKCLFRARELGLSMNAIRLREFGATQGLQACAHALILALSNNATSHEQRFSLLRDHVKAFCDEFGCDFDEVLLIYGDRLCKANEVSSLSISEAASVVRCCCSDEKKSAGTLEVVRACIRSGYADESLLQQAHRAIEWASSNSALQSEMEEASRLLLIDSIISKYCGKAARELFRVDNPKHAMRLMDYVIRRIKSSDQINDVLDLCEAFIHLPKRDSIVSLMRQGVVQGDAGLCMDLMNTLYEKEASFADAVLVGALSFILEILSEVCSLESMSTTNKEVAKKASEIGCGLLDVALQRGRGLSSSFDSDIHCFINGDTLAEFRAQFLRQHELMTYSLFLSMSDLLNPRKQIETTTIALQWAVNAFVENDYKRFVTGIKKAERVCMLLTGRNSEEKQDIWKVATSCVAELLVFEVDTVRFGEYLHGSGLFDGERNGVACRGLLRLALSLCADRGQDIYEETVTKEAFEMSLAASLIRDHAIHLCDSITLPSVIDIDSFFDPCHVVLTMTDNGLGDRIIQFRESLVTMSSRTTPGQYRQSESALGALTIHQPSMHPTWYHGDGLLLPPEQTTSILKWFCRSTIQRTKNPSQASAELQRLLSEKGSNFSRLRILNTFWSKFLVIPGLHVSINISEEVTANFENSIQSLAERSVGGTGVGMTNGVIDSELSVAFLLLLPVKLAYKIYTSTIPAASRKQLYSRLSTLANIGKAICTGSAGAIPLEQQSSSWAKQQKFFDRCKRVALQASWWIRLSERGVAFDPGQFDAPDDKANSGESYAASLIPSLIASFSKDLEPNSIVDLLTAFANDFRIDPSQVVELYIEYILAPVPIQQQVNELALTSIDSRVDLAFCTRVTQQFARRIQPLDRTQVLRRCVRSYEVADGGIVNYERFGCVISLYREALLNVLDKSELLLMIDPAPFELELELVDRRKDALEILSAYFSGPRIPFRPDFLGFFKPIAKNFGESSRVDNSGLSVLGPSEDQFDPLSPLRRAMSLPNNITTSSALSPLCPALGLPQGYIRARFLIARFELSVTNHTSLPLFENEVEPVLEKLRSTRDKALLAEWAAERYLRQDEDRLKCYELALNAAMQASSEIEYRRRDTPGLAEMETESLEAVRRITIAKGSLSDKLRVTAILGSHGSKPGSCLDLLVSETLDALQQLEEPNPENLMDFVLRKTSCLAAKWSLDASKSLSTTHMRHLSTLVNRVCIALSEQHSHIDPQRHARVLASSWLFYGNTDSPEQTILEESDALPGIPIKELSSIRDEDENDTLDFVLDLDGLGRSESVSSKAGKSHEITESRQTSEEEPSALKCCSSRENSEKDSQLAALRVAFVLASSVDKGMRSIDENASPRFNKPSTTPVSKKRFGLLAKVGSAKEYKDTNDVARQVARQLLQVAFAKKVFKVDAFNDSVHASIGEIDGYTSKTITYAMRHRALRAAAVLCPQEILEDICYEEAYLRLQLEMKDSTLKMCSFGVFVAKEIEEMGLQLPHSDLPQLSSMNFPSYARTLWRHNRDAGVAASNGRLLLLMTDMILRDEVVDGEFVSLLLKEMVRIVLPRTQLFALERIARSPHAESCKNSDLCGNMLWKTLESTANSIITEAFSSALSDSTDDSFAASAAETILRLSRLMVLLCGFEQVEKLKFFLRIAAKLSRETNNQHLKVSLMSVVQDIEQHQNSVELTLRSNA